MSTSTGYPVVYCPDHPRAWSTGYIHAHVVVAESKIGRLLLKGEVVHHIDENKFNFEPSNLEVKSSPSEHAKMHAKHGQTMISANCKWCGNEFKRRKGRTLIMCSRSCNGKASMAAKYGTVSVLSSKQVNRNLD